jgi:hypothetical protein
MFSEKWISHSAEGSVRGVICVANAAQSWMYGSKRQNSFSQDSGCAVRESNTAPFELQVRSVTDWAIQHQYLTLRISKTSLSAVRTRFMLSDRRFARCSAECSNSINSTCTVVSSLLFGSQFNFLKTRVRTVTASAEGVLIGSYTLFVTVSLPLKRNSPLVSPPLNEGLTETRSFFPPRLPLPVSHSAKLRFWQMIILRHQPVCGEK